MLSVGIESEEFWLKYDWSVCESAILLVVAVDIFSLLSVDCPQADVDDDNKDEGLLKLSLDETMNDVDVICR